MITKPNDISLNYTDLGANIKVANNACFHKRKPWRRGKEDIPEEDWEDPEVWFSICVSCDEDPHDIVTRIRHEWDKSGGRRLQVKNLPTNRLARRCHSNVSHVQPSAASGLPLPKSGLFEAARDKEATKSI